VSALAGCLDFARASVSEPFVDGLVASAAGPFDDLRTSWQAGPVGLAIRCAPEAAAPGRQLAVDEVRGCTVAFEGRLDNAAELRRLLGTDAPAPEAGAAEHVLAAYLHWGADHLGRLLGDFALAVWDGRDESLLLARDPFGAKRLCYAQRDDRLVFASTPEQLLRGADVPPDVDEDVLLWYLYGASPAPQGRTFLRQIASLPGGHRLVVRRGARPGAMQVDVERWWQWPSEPPDRFVPRDEAVDQFRALFTEAVRTRMPADEGVAVFLSGGLDSGAVAAVAGRVGQDRSADVRLYSLVFDELVDLDERRYSEAVADATAFEHVLVPADELWTLAHLDAWLPYFSEPFMGASDAAIHALLGRAREAGARRVLFGHGGDHIATGSPRYLADWLVHGRLGGVLQEARAQAARGLGSVPRRLAAGALFPLAPEFVQRAGERRHGFPPREWIPPALGARHGADKPTQIHTGPRAWWHDLRTGIAGFGQLPIAGYDGMLRSFGLEHGNPFLDVRLAQLVLRVAPETLYRDGTTKRILRDALHDVLPPLVRDRPDKAVMTPLLHRGLRERRRSFVEALLTDAELERRGYVVGLAWREMVQRYLAGDDTLAAQCWISLTAELWLRVLEGRVPEGA
jgi:asparagine synthase (glutamine-hydrolysing)